MISRLPFHRTLWILPMQAACLVVVGVFLGALVTVSIYLAAAVALLAIALGLLTLEQRLVTFFVGALLLGLLGYMFLGRGFAYAGVAPLYVGEGLLGLAILSGIYTFSIRNYSSLHVAIALFIAWGLIRTVPYVSTYGIDALRDAVVWGYAVFALAISVVITPKIFDRAFGVYARLVPYFLIWVPIVGLMDFLGVIPVWPQSGVSIAQFKQGDMAVHVAGIIALLVSGMYDAQRPSTRLPASLLWLMIIAGLGFIATSRAGFLTVLAGIGAGFLLWPTRRLLSFIAVMVVVGGLIVAINPNVSVGGQSRQVGPEQIIENVNSIVGSSDSGNLQGTKAWREAWWGEIWEYTVKGPYFISGKGFGVNLAFDDGFETFSNPPSRSPHSGHMTILARMGVPGLSLWIAIQVLFGFSIYQAFSRAKAAGSLFWARIDTCILVYWLALLINMSFDVYLEGPQGGIWYWTTLGLGMGALRLQNQTVNEPQFVLEPGELRRY